MQQLVLVPLAEAAAQHQLYTYGKCSDHRSVRQTTPAGSGMVSDVLNVMRETLLFPVDCRASW